MPTQPGIGESDDDATMVTDQSMALPLTAGPTHSYGADDLQSSAPTTMGYEIEDNRKQGLMIVGGVLALGLIGYLMFSVDGGQSDGPLGTMLGSLGLGDDSLNMEIQQTARPIANTVVKEPVPSRKNAAPPENPYWELPNYPGIALDTQREWTRDEELFWKDGMSHPFNYQRYRTIQEVRKFRLKGSEKILYEGLKEKKLWLRMASAMGLADLGVAVDVETVEKIIAETRPSLLRNYFKRFKYRGTRGEIYILRHSLKLVDASTRLIIMQALARTKDKLRPLYLAAATYDPGPGIANFAQAQLGRIGVSEKKYRNMRDMVAGNIPLSEEFSGSIPEEPETKTARRVNASEFGQTVEYFDSKQPTTRNAAKVQAGDGFDELGVIEINLEE